MIRIYKQLVEKILFTLVVLAGFQLSSNAQCDANFTYTVDSVQGIVSCTNTSTIGTIDSPVVYTWYEIPGNVLSNSVNPNIPFTDGVHTLCLIMENDSCVDTFCTVIVMPARYCLAQYTYLVNNTSGEVQFTNQSTGVNSEYIWSFGDGVSFSTDANPIHTYENGWYYVCLNIQNPDSSCSDVDCHFIRIQKPTPTPCIADFNYEYDTVNSKIVHFSNQTFSDSSTSVIWLFPGEQTDTTNQPSFDFQTVGNYTVCLLVSGPLCADSICKTIEVIQVLPVCDANFTYQLFKDTVTGGTPRIAVFNNQSVGNNLSYEWYVNDSLVSINQDPIYYYPTDGFYKVCLVASNQNLCSDSTCQQITILSSTGIENAQDCGISISPNPALTEVRIDVTDCMEQVEHLTIYSMMGTLAYEQSAEITSVTIPLANWAKGMYIVEVKTTHYLIRKKLSIL